MNEDINKDKKKENLILKYRDDKFLAGLPFKLPLKKFLDIDKYFSTPPKIPKKYNIVYTYRDYNKDKVKDNIIHIFTLKGKYIVSLPINNFNFKKIGGEEDPPLPLHKVLPQNNVQPKNNDPSQNSNIPQVNTIVTKDETSFGQYLRKAIASGLGNGIGYFVVGTVASSFSMGDGGNGGDE